MLLLALALNAHAADVFDPEVQTLHVTEGQLVEILDEDVFAIDATVLTDDGPAVVSGFAHREGRWLVSRKFGRAPLVEVDGIYVGDLTHFGVLDILGATTDDPTVAAHGEYGFWPWSFECVLDEDDHGDCYDACRERGHDMGWAEEALMTGAYQCNYLKCTCADWTPDGDLATTTMETPDR